MESTKEEIRHIVDFYYLRGKNAAKAVKQICEGYGSNTVTIRTAQRWFDRFRSGVVDVKDTPRIGRPILVETDEIVEIIKVDRHVSIRSIAQELGKDDKTVWNHLQKIGFQKKLNVWVPHELTEKNLLDRINACDALLKRNEFDPFLKRIVTGDEKWFTYENLKRKRSMSCIMGCSLFPFQRGLRLSVDLALVVTTNYSEDMQVHATETVRAVKFWLERLADLGGRENGSSPNSKP
ncbi:histone-lysine N-methyltransferase SETMAR-like [Hermetia illucens]|uniref:histone-lysine N-methyltransferase SETMAR-like n=1 Tax=Hermetia illucens TaxID=343691 RepID=UPI0018CC04D9|nr:histone-lysine N-methyltransferase SETMAR-like [Hermetia illucens]